MLSKIPYESLSEYIASKCNGAKFILDGFAGVGSLTIKMASIGIVASSPSPKSSTDQLSAAVGGTLNSQPPRNATASSPPSNSATVVRNCEWLSDSESSEIALAP